ncbi:MAG TPA: xanthine dehydrogenase family protein molybdopterin-binding subunit [Candidatus Binatia bacterium]|nr:xanthine dehydrogenase family protein molybdopterin-binding subunit [Candidatus Binatia bacterium]
MALKDPSLRAREKNYLSPLVKRFKVIGKSHPRLDGPETVTGEARYTVDVLLPSMLHAKLFRSSVPHAKIQRLDVSRARALPGVIAVLTASDVPRKRFGFTVQDEEICASEKVRHVGDVIAAVAAVNEETAEEAIRLINWDYQELPAALTTDEALQEKAALVHEDLSSYRLNTALARDWRPIPGTNIAHQAVFSKGDIDAGFAAADEIFDDTFYSQQVQHCSLEPHAVVADWDGNRLTVCTSTQKVFLVRSGLADLFDLPESQIRIIGTKVGAGFGGKNAMRLEPCAAALALKTGRPVRLVNSRAEEFAAAAGSVPATVRVRTGVKRDGTITARAMDFTWDTGAYAEGLPGSNRALKDGVGPYKIPHIRVTSTLVYTNKVRGCPFRGLGIPEAVWAGESQMDIIAEKLGIDPVDLRLKNCLDQGDETPAGDRAHHIALRECLLKVSAELKRWKKQAPSHHGFGVALLHKSPTTSAASSNARVRIGSDGKVELFIGATDVGGGTGTSLAQIAAEELGVPLDEIEVVIADTELTPFDHGTYSSRVTPYVGAAVKRAAADARQLLLQAASQLWNVPVDELRLANERVVTKSRRSISFGEIVKKSGATEILGLGSVESKRLWAGDDSGGKSFTAPGWPFGAQAVEIAVDRETGLVTLIRVASAHDVGRAINPMAVTGQIQGGIMMGLGYALWEGLCLEEGTVTNASFADYKIATARDIPTATPIIVEKNYAAEPYGAKGVGEMAVFGIAPAIANAIAGAVGVRIKELPISAEKLLEQLKKSNNHDHALRRSKKRELRQRT